MGTTSSSVDTVLQEAAASGDVDKVVSVARAYPHLVDAAHPHRAGRTPMHIAASSGCTAVIEALLGLGSKSLDRPDGNGQTPMHLAAMHGHPTAVETLHRLGSKSLDRPDNSGWTPMHVAARSGFASVVETLHRLGSTSLDRCDRYSWTPMYAAAMQGNTAVIETLHRLGSTALDQPDNYGWTPMDIATKNGHAAAVEALIRLGSTTLGHKGNELLASAFKGNCTAVAELLFAAGVDPAALTDRYPQEARQLLATPAEQLLQLRHKLYFSSTLVDLLLQAK